MASWLKMFFATSIAKFSTKAIRLFNLGKGSALPGRIALALCPQYIENFAEVSKDADYKFFVTGTNGKTTSTGLLKQIVLQRDLVISNDRGANLYYGIAAELVNSTKLSGDFISNNYALELDEACFPQISEKLKAKSVTVTNLYRDQLDRFGEIDSTQKLIIEGIQNIEERIDLILNADDSNVAAIAEQVDNADAFFYSVKSDTSIKNFEEQKQSSVEADFIVEVLEEGLGFSRLKLFAEDLSIEVKLELPGLYNVYNAAAAAATAYKAGFSLEEIKQGLESYKSAFGRSEEKEFNGVPYKVFLIKNPTGATEVLKYLAMDDKAKFLIAINDNYADGRDVSWLWDAEFERLRESEIICSGSRAYDMATRLKYSGQQNIKMIPDLKDALIQACDSKQEEENLYLLPTYTALLELDSF